MELVPQRTLGRSDVVVGDLDHPLDVIANQRERVIADARGPERIRGDPADLGHDGLAGGERGDHRRAPLRLDADHPDPVVEPRRDPRERPTAAAAHQDRVDVGHLLVDLEPDRPLAGDHLGLVERMHHQRAGLGLPLAERRLRLGPVALDDRDVRAVAADARDLRLGRRRGDEDLGRHTDLAGRVRHGRAEVAAGCRDHTGRRHVAG
jgi:hypothetical protein